MPCLLRSMHKSHYFSHAQSQPIQELSRRAVGDGNASTALVITVASVGAAVAIFILWYWIKYWSQCGRPDSSRWLERRTIYHRTTPPRSRPADFTVRSSATVGLPFGWLRSTARPLSPLAQPPPPPYSHDRAFDGLPPEFPLQDRRHREDRRYSVHETPPMEHQQGRHEPSPFLGCNPDVDGPPILPSRRGSAIIPPQAGAHRFSNLPSSYWDPPRRHSFQESPARVAADGMSAFPLRRVSEFPGRRGSGCPPHLAENHRAGRYHVERHAFPAPRHRQRRHMDPFLQRGFARPLARHRHRRGSDAYSFQRRRESAPPDFVRRQTPAMDHLPVHHDRYGGVGLRRVPHRYGVVGRFPEVW